MKLKTRRITALFVLMIFLLTVSGSTVLAGTPGESFDVIMMTTGPYEAGLPKRVWTDAQGITHIRGMPGIIYNIQELVPIGEGTFTYNMDIDAFVNGYVSLRAKITLYGDRYTMLASGEITGGLIELSFLIVGREGYIRGTVTGVMEEPGLNFIGTWIR